MQRTTTPQEVINLVKELENRGIKGDLNYLYKRQRNWGLSLAGHQWKGQPVSHTWVKIIELAKRRMVNLMDPADPGAENLAFLKAQTRRGGFFDTNWINELHTRPARIMSVGNTATPTSTPLR